MPTLYKNATSPFGRIAHAGLLHAGLSRLEVRMVDQWSDPEELLAVNGAGRIPCLVLDDGTAIAETLLIAFHADRAGMRTGGLLGSNPRILALTGIALGVCDAAVAILVGRRIVSGNFADTAFDGNALATKRRRTIVDGLKRLDDACADMRPEDLDLAVIATVTAVDYVDLRFPGADWVPAVPRLRDFARRAGEAEPLAATRPPL